MQTIVTNDDLEKQDEANSMSPVAPFIVEDAHVSQGKTPSIEGGYPTENYPKVSDETLKKIGEAEAKKTRATEADLNTKKFENLVTKNSTKTLLQIKSAKPLDFFPAHITIDINKVNISKRDYFFSRHLHTIPVENIQDVFVEMTPFFATIKVIDKGYVENTIEVPFLKKEDAKKVRRVVQGLITAYKEGVDLASLPDEDLVAKLEILGDAGAAETAKS